MLQPQPFGVEYNQNGKNPPSQEFSKGNSFTDTQGQGNLDIQQELNRLEEIILASPRIPLTKRTLVDEEKLLEQLDFVRVSLPDAFQESVTLLQQKEEILLQAEEYGQQIVDAAQAKRAQILDENDIIRQAEREAEKIQRQVQQECEAMMEETLAEIDRKRRACQQEIEEMRRQAIAEADEIAQGADNYADNVLANIEQELNDMLRIVHNGRQQLYADTPPHRSSNSHKKK